MRSALRWSVRVLLTVLLLVEGILGYAVGQQWFFRWRCERLLADVERLKVHRGDWEELNSFITRWGRWGDYQGACDASHCDYQVRLTDVFPEWCHFEALRVDGKPRRILAWIGVRPVSVRAGVEVVTNVIVRKSFSMSVDQNVNGEDLEMVAGTVEASRLSDFGNNDKLLHPNRSLHVLPRGYFIVDFTPAETPDEKNRLMHFRIACITTLNPCLQSGDLLPEAYFEWAAQQSRLGSSLHPDCDLPLWLRARDATRIFVGDVVSASRRTKWEDGTPAAPYWVTKVQLNKILKGAIPLPKDSIFTIEFSELELGIRSGESFPYKSIIGLGDLQRPYDELMTAPIEIADCAVEATPANLSSVERGLNEDFNPNSD